MEGGWGGGVGWGLDGGRWRVIVITPFLRGPQERPSSLPFSELRHHITHNITERKYERSSQSGINSVTSRLVSSRRLAALETAVKRRTYNCHDIPQATDTTVEGGRGGWATTRSDINVKQTTSNKNKTL